MGIINELTYQIFSRQNIYELPSKDKIKKNLSKNTKSRLPPTASAMKKGAILAYKASIPSKAFQLAASETAETMGDTSDFSNHERRAYTKIQKVIAGCQGNRVLPGQTLFIEKKGKKKNDIKLEGEFNPKGWHVRGITRSPHKKIDEHTAYNRKQFSKLWKESRERYKTLVDKNTPESVKQEIRRTSPAVMRKVNDLYRAAYKRDPGLQPTDK